MGSVFIHSLMSMSAFREIVICKEIEHENVVRIQDVFLDPMEKSIQLVFEYAEFDLLASTYLHSGNITRLFQHYFNLS